MGSYAQSSNKEEESCIPAVRRFHVGVCGVCYSMEMEGSSLLRCSQCQLISYCSKACQRKDWPVHKPLCIVNKALNNKNIFSSAQEVLAEKDDWKHWFQLRSDLSLACSVNLKRSLAARERELFLFPRVCEVCKEAKSSLLTACTVCYSTFYCSHDHKEIDKEKHKRWCQNYLLCLQCDSIEAKEGIQDLPFPTHVDETYKPLPKDLMTLLRPQLMVDPSKTLDHRFVTMIGERLSFPLSLQYALEKLEKNQLPLLTSPNLKIHVIGAESSVELLGIIRWEYFLHRLPSLEKLHMVFVGPNLFKSFETMDGFQMGEHCLEDSGSTRCEDCTDKSRIVVYEMATRLYHEYEESKHFGEPDAIIAFNCGFHEFRNEANDTWTKSLELITKMDVPLIFTSYNEVEAGKDLQVIKECNKDVQIKIGPHLNPFCSPRPVRDPSREDNHQIFFCNQYLTCVQGSPSAV